MAESKNKAGKIRAKAIELWSRLTNFNEKLDVYLNGEDNQYPIEIERVVNNAPTGKRSANMLSKFVAGAGVTDDGVINKKKNLKKSDLVKSIADDVSVHYGAWIHVGYEFTKDAKLKPVNPQVLDYKKCRISKEDAEDNKGKIYYADYSTEKKQGRLSKKQKQPWYYPFNSDENVVIAQIKKDAKDAKIAGDKIEDLLPSYRGQVYYLNLTPQHVYAVSLYDGVFNDCDTEYRMSLYTNSVTRTGFLGKVAVITQGLDPEDEDQVDEDVENWLGAEEASTVWRLSIGETADIDKVVKIIQVKSQYDEKQFTETRKNCRMNILGAANNIPEALVFNSGGLFSQSGEAYQKLKEFYNEQTEYERGKVEQTMVLLGFPCSIIPIIKLDDTGDSGTDDETKKAQAALRGSVEGVQGILGIQQSVSQQLTDFESAITILMEIYGFSRSISAALLGQPEIEVKQVVKMLTKKYGVKKKLSVLLTRDLKNTT